MDEKLKSTVKNVLTIGGAIAIACALLDEVTDELDFEKLTSETNGKPIPMLESGQEKREDSEDKEKSDHEKPEQERKSQDDEVAELKRKLAKYENSPDEKKNEE